jgi:hypothetical protein
MMQESVSIFMPEIAAVVSDELERTLEAHDIVGRTNRAAYNQEYSYSLPYAPGQEFTLEEALAGVADRVAENYRHICRQAAMYELMKPQRSVHYRVREGEEALALPEDDKLLDAVLYGPERVQRELRAQRQLVTEGANGLTAAESGADGAGATNRPEGTGEDIVINILDKDASDAVDIVLSGESTELDFGELEANYAEKLDNIAVKTNRIFGVVLDDLFGDNELLPRLKRLFWLEATKAERDYNNFIIKPMLRQHDRNLSDLELRDAMEVDLESVSDVEELMRVWEGLHNLEGSLPI